MKNEWDEYANTWDTNPHVIQYAELAFKSLQQELNIHNKTVLDFGCGTGVLSAKMAKEAKQLVALDSSQAMIKVLEAKAISNITTHAKDLDKNFLSTHTHYHNAFDVIVASSVCAFVEDYTATLRSIHTLLKSGGIFIQFDWLIESYKKAEGFDKQTVLSNLTQTAFTDIRVEQTFSLQHEQGSMAVLRAIAHK